MTPLLKIIGDHSNQSSRLTFDNQAVRFVSLVLVCFKVMLFETVSHVLFYLCSCHIVTDNFYIINIYLKTGICSRSV